jgi:hypothetical protein
MLDITDDAMQLAEEIIQLKGVPEQYPEDALHLAVAAVNGIDLIVTWNFAHLNNPFTRIKVRRIIEQADIVVLNLRHPKNYWRSNHDRPDCGRSKKSPYGTYHASACNAKARYLRLAWDSAAKAVLRFSVDFV